MSQRATKVLVLGANGQLARNQLTQKGEPFIGHDVSLNSVSDLITRLAASPGPHVRCSLGLSRG